MGAVAAPEEQVWQAMLEGYGWAEQCEQRFGTHPGQVINEVNGAAHVADVGAEPDKRAFTREELQALFDYADAEIARKRELGRKGWLPAVRDVTIFKAACGCRTSTAAPRPSASACSRPRHP
ncbi:hypothetical protein [Parasphingorhabdus pacifica]